MADTCIIIASGKQIPYVVAESESQPLALLKYRVGPPHAITKTKDHFADAHSRFSRPSHSMDYYPAHGACDCGLIFSRLLRTLMLQPRKCMLWAVVLGAAPRVHMLELCTTTVLQPRAATFRDGSAEQM